MSMFNTPDSILDKVNVLDLEKFKTFRFAIAIDNSTPEKISPEEYGYSMIAGVEKISGLQDEVEIKTVKELGFSGVHQYPRSRRPSQIEIEHGVTFSRYLFDWYQEVLNWTKGKPDYRRQVSIFLLDDITVAGQTGTYETWRWDIRNAYPMNWVGPRLDANRSDTAFESVKLVHDGIVEDKSIFSSKGGELVSLVM